MAMVKGMAKGLTDGRQTLADTRAAVAARTATKEQMDLVKGMAKGLADGPKACR